MLVSPLFRSALLFPLLWQSAQTVSFLQLVFPILWATPDCKQDLGKLGEKVLELGYPQTSVPIPIVGVIPLG